MLISLNQTSFSRWGAAQCGADVIVTLSDTKRSSYAEIARFGVFYALQNNLSKTTSRDKDSEKDYSDNCRWSRLSNSDRHPSAGIDGPTYPEGLKTVSCFLHGQNHHSGGWFGIRALTHLSSFRAEQICNCCMLAREMRKRSTLP